MTLRLGRYELGVRALIWGLIAAGLVVRVVLAFKTYGVIPDINAFKSVRAALSDDPLHVYATVNGHPYNQWPYPPLYFAWIVPAGKIADATGAFHGWIQLPQILADCAIAWLVQDFLRGRGAGDRMRLAATALVALGPAFWIVSGYHGQIDSVAILPAVLALWLWDRMAPGVKRAAVAGLLIGIGIGVKTVPVVMLVVLLPSVRSRREAVAMIGAAVAVPLVALAPFLIGDAHGTIHALRSHRALPGMGGIGLLAQPDLANIWLHMQRVHLTSFSQFLSDHEPLIVAFLMAPFAALVLLRRPPPVVAASILWPALTLLSVGFGPEYLIWALPFALMAGFLWQVAALQAALLVPLVILYWHPFDRAPAAIYVPMMIAIWLVATVAVVRHAVRVAARPVA